VPTDLLVHRTHEVLVQEGYKLVEDAWEECGRRTYLHDEDASREHINALASLLRSAGWQTESRKLRAFRHAGSQYEIELEPGGSAVTGHFLHCMKPMPLDHTCPTDPAAQDHKAC
jgi:hypothetical protein